MKTRLIQTFAIFLLAAQILSPVYADTPINLQDMPVPIHSVVVSSNKTSGKENPVSGTRAVSVDSMNGGQSFADSPALSRPEDSAASSSGSSAGTAAGRSSSGSAGTGSENPNNDLPAQLPPNAENGTDPMSTVNDANLKMQKSRELEKLREKWNTYRSLVDTQLNALKMLKAQLDDTNKKMTDVNNALSALIGAIQNAPVIPGFPAGIPWPLLALFNATRNAVNADFTTAYNDTKAALDGAINDLKAEKGKCDQVEVDIANALRAVYEGNEPAAIQDPPIDIAQSIKDKISTANDKFKIATLKWKQMRRLAERVLAAVMRVIRLYKVLGIALNAAQQNVVDKANELADVLRQSLA